MFTDLAINLRAGLKLLLLLRTRASDFRVSLSQCLVLAAIGMATFIGEDRLVAEPGAAFIAWNLPQPGWIVLCVILGTALIALVQDTSALVLATAVASLTPWLIALMWLVGKLASRWPLHLAQIELGLLVLSAIALTHAIAITSRRRTFRAMVAGLVFFAVCIASIGWLQLDPRVWGIDEPDNGSADANETAQIDEARLYRQPALLEEQANGLAAQRPGVVDLYFIGFAGDGAQRIFSREVKFSESVLDRHFDLQGRAAELINDNDDNSSTPLASYAALKLTLQAMAEHMDLSEDVLFLFLSSHGSPEHELSVQYAGWPLHQLQPEDVAHALDEARIRWRVVVVSACYSGGFIEPLRNDTSLIITAAAADRSSFGCSDENELTYFGDAFFKQALAVTPSFSHAFEIAKRIIERREAEEHLTASLPQIFVGAAIEKKLAQLHSNGLVHARLDPIAKRANISISLQ